MKTFTLVLLAVVCSELLTPAGRAQVYNQRRLLRPIAPQVGQTNPPARPSAAVQSPAPVPAPGTMPAAPATLPTARPRMTQAVVRVVRPPVDPEKARAAREEAVRRTIAFQMKRAEEGSESAQYELGLRYLKGDGVERDEAKGRHWLGLSAKNGYGPAARKLEELDKPAEPLLTPAP